MLTTVESQAYCMKIVYHWNMAKVCNTFNRFFATLFSGKEFDWIWDPSRKNSPSVVNLKPSKRLFCCNRFQNAVFKVTCYFLNC